MIRGAAILSADQKYRFWLTRTGMCEIGPLFPCDSPAWVSIGINPSVADDTRPDPTISTEMGFARHHGCDLLVKVNLRAFIATKPETMLRAARDGVDVVGGEMNVALSPGIDLKWFDAGDVWDGPVDGRWSNRLALKCAFLLAKRRRGIVLAGWGVPGGKDDVAVVVELAASIGVDLMCIGVNEDGSPTHPLYQPHEAPLLKWDPKGWHPKGPKRRR